MKTILGLDLGVASIGWALILVSDDNQPIKIIRLGVRRIPIDSEESQQFTAGNAFTKNQDRTRSRSQRKGYDRYQQRRQLLTMELRRLGMLPDEKLIKLPVLKLWELRAKAAEGKEKLTLPEIGRILYRINQKRGYKHSKRDMSGDVKERDYVAKINDRYRLIRETNQTIGQYFFSELKRTALETPKGILCTFRIKEQIFPRGAYEEEFDRIMAAQKVFYPDILTDEVIEHLRNYIIFYQRRLKSCKHLIGHCELEKHFCVRADGKMVPSGPRVAAKSNPLFQLDKIWESVNNITLTNKYGDELFITLEQKNEIVHFLQKNPILKVTDLYKILKINKKEWFLNASIKKGLQGNTTTQKLREVLGEGGNVEQLLKFHISYEDSQRVDEVTGEHLKEVSSACIEEPLYKLWHMVYSIKDKSELARALYREFGIKDRQIVDNLYKIDFEKSGYGNKSVRAIRKILPYLQQGLKYSDACEYVGYNHSNSLTTEENKNRELLDKLPLLNKNELRQPIVEKVLNQMINIINKIIESYGRPDTIRVELARELKRSRDERSKISEYINKQERENNKIAKHLREEGISATRNRIERYRLWKESGNTCFYCGKVINEKEFLSSSEVETEHIIPKALLFDNSFSNKVCACHKCNAEKDNSTAYDFMKNSRSGDFENYVVRVNEMFAKGKISKTKRDRLLTSADDIPQDFINRDLRLTQYISRKALEILKSICYNVTASSGSVTDFIRHIWGYDKILHQLNFQRYKNGGLTELREYEHCGQTHEEEVISNWSKRLDHRHHAIDALVVAMTQQSVIQRMNTLNVSRNAMFQDISMQSNAWKHDYSLLQQWLFERKHFSTEEVKKFIAGIIVSGKVKSKVASTGTRAIYSNGKRKVVQKGILAPRGALHEDSLYGKINVTPDKQACVIKYKLGVGAMKFLFTGKETYKEDIKVNKTTGLKEVKVTDKIKDVLDTIVDGNIRRRVLMRLNEGFAEGQDYKNDVKKALNNLKDISVRPLYTDDKHQIPIHSIRCYTGLSAVVPLRYNAAGKPIGFVKNGNNHHVAIYKDSGGKFHESVVSFWQAVERKRLGLPVIIESPQNLWESIADKDFPEEQLNSLPEEKWKFVLSLQRNEFLILGMEEDEYQRAIRENDYTALNDYLYVVQSLSNKDYRFCLATSTQYNNEEANKPDKRFLRIRSFNALFGYNPHKVKVDILGNIIF